MNKLIIEDLYADWCGPCKMVANSLNMLKGEFGDDLQIEKFNIDNEPEIAEKYKVQSIPTLIFKVHGAVVETVIGNVPIDRLREKIKKHLGV